MNKEPRLRFTDEERSDPALEKPIRKAEKAAARADKAQANIPKKKVSQTVIDPDTGKKTSKLTFEDMKTSLPAMPFSSIGIWMVPQTMWESLSAPMAAVFIPWREIPAMPARSRVMT